MLLDELTSFLDENDQVWMVFLYMLPFLFLDGTSWIQGNLFFQLLLFESEMLMITKSNFMSRIASLTRKFDSVTHLIQSCPLSLVRFCKIPLEMQPLFVTWLF